MRKLVLFPLVVAFLIVAILGSSHTATAQTQASLEGTVTVNGELRFSHFDLTWIGDEKVPPGNVLWRRWHKDDFSRHAIPNVYLNFSVSPLITGFI